MMGSPEFVSAVGTAISDAAGTFHIERATPASGGCIHRSFILEGGGRRFFAKINDRSWLDAFAAESDCLAALAAAGVRVPAPVCRGELENDAFLVLEYLDLRGKGSYTALGRDLAALHSVRGERYGWRRDNYIGSTPQRNGLSHSWSGFWREQRLLPQLRLAQKTGCSMSLAGKGEQLAAALPQLLSGHEPAASLLHGDLWSGNVGFVTGGEPVLLDPAVYYGDRETDLAMTELFGGFTRDFYHAYREAAPLDSGYAVRKALYNLYHVLNHANLFGGGYAAQAETMIDRLLAETR